MKEKERDRESENEYTGGKSLPSIVSGEVIVVICAHDVYFLKKTVFIKGLALSGCTELNRDRILNFCALLLLTLDGYR